MKSSKLIISFIMITMSGQAFAHGEGKESEKYLSKSSVAYEKSSAGTRTFDHKYAKDVWLKMLVEKSNLGSSEVEVGELFLPAGLATPEHPHGSLEIFYVISGEMLHIVNGIEYPLKPGMVGIVRPGDTVSHVVPGDKPCRVLGIWSPGDEIERLAGEFIERK